MTTPNSTPYFSIAQDASLDSLIESIVRISKNLKCGSKPESTYSYPQQRETYDFGEGGYAQKHISSMLQNQSFSKPFAEEVVLQQKAKYAYEEKPHPEISKPDYKDFRQDYRSKFERPRSSRLTSTPKMAIMKNAEISPMKFQPDFEEELKGGDEQLDPNRQIYEEKIKQRDEQHHKNISIHRKMESKIDKENFMIDERENRFLRNKSHSRAPNPPADNFKKALMGTRSKTPNRMSSLEDVYKKNTIEQKVNVPISSKFMNIPTNIKHKTVTHRV
jgi:hypothetical protein